MTTWCYLVLQPTRFRGICVQADRSIRRKTTAQTDLCDLSASLFFAFLIVFSSVRHSRHHPPYRVPELLNVLFHFPLPPQFLPPLPNAINCGSPPRRSNPSKSSNAVFRLFYKCAKRSNSNNRQKKTCPFGHALEKRLAIKLIILCRKSPSRTSRPPPRKSAFRMAHTPFRYNSRVLLQEHDTTP